MGEYSLRRSMRLLAPVTAGTLALACGLGCSSKSKTVGITGATTSPVNSGASPAPASSGTASGKPGAPAAPGGSNKAPSTGSELAKPSQPLPTQAEAEAALAAVLAEAGKPSADCDKIISPKTRLVFGLASPTPAAIKQNMAAYATIGRCAEKAEYFNFLKSLSLAMLQADEVNGHPELLARAYLGLNSPLSAMKVIDIASKKNPKDANVFLTAAKVSCRMTTWAQCRDFADKAFKLSQTAEPAEKQAVASRAKKYSARSLLHLGKVDEASKAADESEKLGGDKTDLDDLRKEMIPARNYKAVVDLDTLPELTLGTYHLLGKLKGTAALVHVTIDNIDTKDRQFRVEAEVPGLTQRMTQTISVLKGKPGATDLTPALKSDFNSSSLRATQHQQLSVKVVALDPSGEKVIYDQTSPLTIQPRDQLPLYRFADQEKADGATENGFIGAWVTPNSKAVDTFLASAKKRAPKATFSGEQAETVPQVKALYEELQGQGMSYVMDPEVLSQDTHSQRTRLPSEVLSSTNAQCIEGAIVYATLFEAIGLKPFIIRVPGHAFVAWQPSPYDKQPPNTLLFLETTMTHGFPFEAAASKGSSEYKDHSSKKQATVIPIAALRKMGITPQPFD